MGFGSALIQLLSAAIGGVIGGSFVLLGVHAQFRRQSEAAFRALMVEVESNYDACAQMKRDQRSGVSDFELGHADPSWLKRSIWDSQLPYVVQVLDPEALKQVARAYGLLEIVPRMFLPPVSGVIQGRYTRGGGFEIQLDKIRDAFRDAKQALEFTEKRLASEHWDNWARAQLQSIKERLP